MNSKLLKFVTLTFCTASCLNMNITAKNTNSVPWTSTPNTIVTYDKNHLIREGKEPVNHSYYKIDNKAIDNIDLIKKKLKEGIPVVICDDELDMKNLYPLFKQMKLPFILEYNENKEMEKKYVNLLDKEDREKVNNIEPVSNELLLQQKKEKEYIHITPLIILTPNNNNIFVDIHDIVTTKKHKNKVKNVIENYINKVNIESEIKQYKQDILKSIIPRSVDMQLSSNAILLTSIRKTQTFYGDFYYAGNYFNNIRAGKHTTDYLIYNAKDQDNDYDHLIVEGISEVYSMNKLNNLAPPYILRAFETKMDNYYSSDKLIDYSPNTSLDMSNGKSYGFTVGYPLSIQFSYYWTGKSGTNMKGIGNKDNQLYYNYFYNKKGLSNSSFTIKYSTMYKSKGTLLKLNYQNLFGLALSGTPSGYEWYGDNWYVLTYDY